MWRALLPPPKCHGRGGALQAKLILRASVCSSEFPRAMHAAPSSRLPAGTTQARAPKREQGQFRSSSSLSSAPVSADHDGGEAAGCACGSPARPALKSRSSDAAPWPPRPAGLPVDHTIRSARWWLPRLRSRRCHCRLPSPTAAPAATAAALQPPAMRTTARSCCHSGA